ncbi:hypothetical protein N7528_004094 [Penicillium herquei]|nr:hypothetical protein N7528_004094 [Penicillium herquei]
MGSPLQPRNEIGNENAAQDLYGLGVRLGYYLQALAWILYQHGDKKSLEYSKGLKLASGSITISILASWFNYAAEAAFSPSEAIVVLMILTSLSLPAKYAAYEAGIILDETIGVITLMLTALAESAALLWAFSSLVHTLSRLGTPNLVFFFSPVSLTGWFRYLALVCLTIDALFSSYLAYRLLRVQIVAWKLSAATNRALGKEESLRYIRKFTSYDLSWISVIGFSLHWLLVIVAVEMTLRWNHLTPSNKRSPGQLIPFLTGCIILVDSLSVVAREHAPLYQILVPIRLLRWLIFTRAGLLRLPHFGMRFAQRTLNLRSSPDSTVGHAIV